MQIDPTCTGTAGIEMINVNTIGGGGWKPVKTLASVADYNTTGKY